MSAKHGDENGNKFNVNPIPLTTNINTEYKQINSLSLFYITFEDKTVFKQTCPLGNLQIKLQRHLSCCHFSPYSRFNWNTKEDHAGNLHANNEAPSIFSITELQTEIWCLQLLTKQVKYKTGKVLFQFHCWITTVTQMKRIKPKLVNGLWITSCY